MVKASQKEAEMVKEVSERGGKNIVSLLDEFMFKGHYCLVMPLMPTSLREVLTRPQYSQGLPLHEVQVIGRQLLESLEALHGVCGIIHCDIKPDNILVDPNNWNIKLADWGTAIHIYEASVNEELGSRYYRSPEIIVGYPYTGSVDVWSSAVTLFELFTHGLLFEGVSNNDMLYRFMKIKGKFPTKMIREGKLATQHFTQDFHLMHIEEDVFGKSVVRRVPNTMSPTRLIGLVKKQEQDSDVRTRLYRFCDLLERMTIIDPQKRLTSAAAVGHSFFEK